MTFAIPVPDLVTLAVKGSDQSFPVRRIYCVGRNYAEHAREMGFDPDREPPFFFMKPADAIVPSGVPVPYPPKTNDLHHEIELVAAIGRAGRDIVVDAALNHVYGYGVGIDLTRRDLQIAARKLGRPWEVGKAFDHSAPCGQLVPAAEVDPRRGAIWLEVNGQPRQRADLADMIWNVAEIVSKLSEYFELRPGDLIFTGTPAGVGAVRPGDEIAGGIDRIGTIRVGISA
jgi:fumarylpyruvate hydrolase